VPTKNNILPQASKILPKTSPFYRVKPIRRCRVGDILRDRERQREEINVRTKHVRRLRGRKLEDLTWSGLVDARNGTTDEVIYEEMKVIGQIFYTETGTYFAPKMRL
jgi:hypothetical protein